MSYLTFVEHLVKEVVDNPEQVEVKEEVEGHTRTFFVHCAPEDYGKVIGKSGRVAHTIRSVVSAVASKHRERAFVRIMTQDD